MESLYFPTRLYDYPEFGLDLHMGEGFTRNPVTGRYIVQNPIGQAVLIFPFFLLGHLAAPLLGSAGDGFSITYQLAMDLAPIFYMFLGLLVLFKILIRYFTPKVVAITLLSLFLGTNFLAHATIEEHLSHIYSFFLICLLLYWVPRWYADPSRVNTIFLGIIAALVPLVRNPNAVFLLFVPFYGITDWKSLKERVYFFWRIKKEVFLLLAVAFLVFLPQMIVWKIATNHFITKSYTFGIMQFNFLHPQIFKVLFHPHHGLFIWSPILIFSVLGLWKLKGPLKSYQLPIIICLLSHLYVVSSWYIWYYGDSFGHRAFVDALGMLVLPLADFYEGLLNANAVVKRVVFLVSTFFIAFTFYAFSQFFLGVLPGELKPSTMTWQQYCQRYENILLKTDGFSEFWHWLKNPQVIDYRLSR
jgi:hypothetical protein